jgi:anti-sigma regulatory factor (Ser/Thr protein kinase)
MDLFSDLQLFIPSAGAFTLLILSFLYLVIFIQFRERIYLAGFLMTVAAALFVLFEALTIKAGLSGLPALGRQFNRVEHLFSAAFLFNLPFLLNHCSRQGRFWRKVLKGMVFAGAGLALALAVTAFVKPELYVSVTEPSPMAALLAGNAGKGLPGPVYMARDILFAVLVVFSLVWSLVLIIKFRERRIIPIFAGLLLAILGAVDDTLYVVLQVKFFLPQFHFSRFSLGLVLMLICFLLGIFSDFVKVQRRYRLSESKYRILSEGVSSAIFSLSEDLKFLSGNEKAIQCFNLQGQLGERGFMEILNWRGNRSRMVGDLILDKFRILREEGAVGFHASISDPRTGEPVEYQFNFRHFHGEREEFIGEAYPRTLSGMVDYIDFERIQISILNYIVLLDDVSSRITCALGRYIPQGVVDMIKMGLQEILMNAIEHGNLNITFDEKTKAQLDDRYLDFIRERQDDPRYKSRKVTVDYLLSDKKVQYRITDEGSGFDYAEVMKQVNDPLNKSQLYHGRGILMALSVFDTVKFNSKGNQVLLEKYFPNGNGNGNGEEIGDNG